MKLALFGCGHMGQEVERLAIAQGHEIGVRLDVENNPEGAGITSEALASIEAAIDFTVPTAVFDNIDRATESVFPWSSEPPGGTTAWTKYGSL